MNEDLVFRALADLNRRKLLDILKQRDGQTLSELQTHLPMTRFGCMKHLKVLEEAGLVATRKIGREKFHYLNPVPIQLVYVRWVSQYAQPWTQTLTGLKTFLENPPINHNHTHVFEVYIRTTPQQLWQALTNGAITPYYYFGSRVEGEWSLGGAYRYVNQDNGLLLQGEVLEVEPLRRLVTTFQPRWQDELSTMPASKVTWEIEPFGAICKLSLTHDELDVTAYPAAQGIISGWNQILSGLKTFLETGEPLPLRR